MGAEVGLSGIQGEAMDGTLGGGGVGGQIKAAAVVGCGGSGRFLS